MYKKITHTIIEEHFDHPLSAQIKKTLIKNKLLAESEDNSTMDTAWAGCPPTPEPAPSPSPSPTT